MCDSACKGAGQGPKTSESDAVTPCRQITADVAIPLRPDRRLLSVQTGVPQDAGERSAFELAMKRDDEERAARDDQQQQLGLAEQRWREQVPAPSRSASSCAPTSVTFASSNTPAPDGTASSNRIRCYSANSSRSTGPIVWSHQIERIHHKEPQPHDWPTTSNATRASAGSQPGGDAGQRYYA